MDIDARGPRFGAAVTTVVLAAVLITGSTWLLAWQVLAFALGASGGVARSPYGWLFRKVVRPRLGPPAQLESPQPPQFAQAVGLVFAVVGLIGFTAGPDWLGFGATGCALAAAFLNAAFGYCLGCEMYLLVRRLTVGAQ
ncbi:DUF4395 domain-containing protein [Streptomyces mirabilis]